MRALLLAFLYPSLISSLSVKTRDHRFLGSLTVSKPISDAPVSRRGVLSITAASSLLVLFPHRSLADDRMLAYLEPLFELQVFVDVVQEQIGSKEYANARTALNSLFSGETPSQLESFFRDYAQKLLGEEDPNELPELRTIQQDTQSAALDGCFKHLRRLRGIVEESSPDGEQAQLEANFAAADMQRWYDALGSDERSEVLQLFLSVREADRDRNGRLDDDEILRLSNEQQSIWKRRSELVDI